MQRGTSHKTHPSTVCPYRTQMTSIKSYISYYYSQFVFNTYRFIFWHSSDLPQSCVMVQHFIHSLHFESFHTEYHAALEISAVAVALGGWWGVVPDRAASGTIAELEPDCSLPPSSSLSFVSTFAIFCMCTNRCTQSHIQMTNVLIHIQNVSSLLTSVSILSVPIGNALQYTLRHKPIPIFY